MAGTNGSGDEGRHENRCASFEWDENSQLYYHASSGFYHDPSAGWYYSSRDGLYYKFEDGIYVLLGSNQGDHSGMRQFEGSFPDEPVQEESCTDAPCHEDEVYALFESEVNKLETVPDEPVAGEAIMLMLEDTLIDLYLSGYSNQEIGAASDARMSAEMEEGDGHGVGINDTHETDPGDCGVLDATGSVLDKGNNQDEENWRAQYGQVVQSGERPMPAFRVVDLWDWELVTETKRDRKGQVARLVGRLVRRSTKLHPSMPSGGGLLKTAPICEAHLDLVRVTSGQFYKLRSPSVGYLKSLSTYDSSNPTNNWGFPELSIDRQTKPQPSTKSIEAVPVHKGVTLSTGQQFISPQNKSHIYRDRAAERRTLHGGFGVGPGQKKTQVDADSTPSSPDSACAEQAAAESWNMSFGADSYARRILENMGWKEGEALGNSTKGLTEPLQATGNKGSAGLGWDQSKRTHL
ncbi:hypothetical protein RJ639_032716 [Escallonia herrerae]|uniref:G-patch domain-containing protein n=1 Tax=Escallonia herrerae TaxID=1293975 RepID=A0AA88V4R8_9ASTE|nr:hypothetical protein RJ639_021575 [Escallonia herrerae]KAK3033487.1 hypothetical protein RJ639_032716 [Escallonia herrerae]